MISKMKKLARKWTKSLQQSHDDYDQDDTLPTIDDARPIDTHEQEELVRFLEDTSARQNRLWRSVFTVLLSCYLAFLLYSIYHQAAYPWELRFHAYFMEDIDSRLVIFSDWLAVMSCVMTILGLVQSSGHHKQWFWFSFFNGSIVAVFWLYYMLRLPKFRWDVIWLPFGPLSGAGVCIYVVHLLEESSKEARKLRSYMYSYKAR